MIPVTSLNKDEMMEKILSIEETLLFSDLIELKKSMDMLGFEIIESEADRVKNMTLVEILDDAISLHYQKKLEDGHHLLLEISSKFDSHHFMISEKCYIDPTCYYPKMKYHRDDDFPALLFYYSNGTYEYTYYKHNKIFRKDNLPSDVSFCPADTKYRYRIDNTKKFNLREVIVDNNTQKIKYALFYLNNKKIDLETILTVESSVSNLTHHELIHLDQYLSTESIYLIEMINL